jgi:hypothetical protein
MIKKSFWTSLVLFALTLSACASNTGMPAFAPNGGPSATELPRQTKLILGVINLEETDYAVTAEQAEELLPMFHVLQELNESDAAAQEEINGLVNQIQETLTDEQTQAIDDMTFSMQDIFAVSRGSSGDTGSSEAVSVPNFGGGGPPDMGAGGLPDMGGGMPGGMPSTVSSASSDETSSAMPVMDNSIPSALFDAVIELLQKKVQ